MKSRAAIDMPVEMWNLYKPFSLDKNRHLYQEEARATATALGNILKKTF